MSLWIRLCNHTYIHTYIHTCDTLMPSLCSSPVHFQLCSGRTAEMLDSYGLMEQQRSAYSRSTRPTSCHPSTSSA